MNLETILFGSVIVITQFYAQRYLEEDKREAFPIKPIDYSLPQIETFDFVVIGGGTAGCIVAGRLSQRKKFRVLVLEAGGYPSPLTTVPIFGYRLQAVPEIAFLYPTIEHDNDGNILKKFTATLGKNLGGTVPNGVHQFNRGSSFDYDGWANITGDNSWRYRNVLRYFKKFETYHGTFPNNDQHGKRGPIPISTQGYTPGYSTIVKAAEELGYINDGPNGGLENTPAITPNEFTSKYGRGVDSCQRYLIPFLGKRKNLKIIKYAYVNEIIFDDTNKPIGVTYTRHGILNYVEATKEIIISAGTYGSPQLLLRSGIGPQKDLISLGITPRFNLPVGSYLQERPLTTIQIIINDTSKVFLPSRDITEESIQVYLKNGTGPLSTPPSKMAQGFMVTSFKKSVGYPNWADIQVVFTRLGTLIEKTNEVFFNALIVVSGTSNIGTVKLDPTNISNSPIIDLNMYSSINIKLYTEAIKTTLKIFETTKEYKKIGARYSTVPVQGCNSFTFRSDDYWDCFIKQSSQPSQDASGTCRMGKRNDPMAVVDSKLRVIGVNGLRVIDGSVMPQLPVNNPMAPTLMIGEKGVADILRRWTRML